MLFHAEIVVAPSFCIYCCFLKIMIMFCLQSDGVLITVPYKSGDAVLERFIPITHVTGMPYKDEPFDNILLLDVFGYTYYLATPNQDERDMWISAIEVLSSTCILPFSFSSAFFPRHYDSFSMN